MLFSYFDDTNADVRILTEETINMIIRSSLNDTNIHRIQTDLCKELKRNGSPRSVRAALTKFAAIVETIKPNKRRQFAMTFLPILMALVKRPEEMIHECIGRCSNRLFKTLSLYFSDDELGSLIRCVLPNLQFPSATARRSAAVLIAELCAHSRKRSDVTSFWLVYIIKELVMLSGKESSTHVLGDLLLLQHLFPIFADTDGENAIDGRTVAAARFDQISDDSWLKLFEAILYYICSTNSVIASAALETLVRIFRNLPARVLCLWTRRGALKFSSFFQSSNPTADTESTPLDQVSVGSLESSPQEHFEISLDEESQFNPRPLSISFKGEQTESPNAAESGYSESGTALEDMISNDGATVAFPLHSDELLDSVSGDSDECSFSTQSANANRRRSETLPSLSLETNFEFESSNFAGQCWLPNKAEEWIQMEFERCLSGESLLQFCARLLSRLFLLAGREGELVPDDQARASHKVLALGVFEEIFSLEPSLFVAPLIDGEAQKLSDLSLFCSHNDPQVRGSASLMIGAMLQSSFRRREVDVLGSSLLDLLFHILSSMTENESNVTIHCALKAFKRAIPLFMAVQPLKLLDRLARMANLADNAYWLVKVRLAECYADIDFCEVSMLEKERTASISFPFSIFAVASAGKSMLANSTWQSISSEKLQQVVMNCLLKKLLVDDSERVRHAGGLAVVNMVRRGHFVGDEMLLKLTRQYALCSQRSRTTWLRGNFPKIHSLSAMFSQSHEMVDDLLANDVEFNLSTIVGAIVELLKCSPLKDGFPIGIIYTLNMLAENFPPVRYARPWLVVKTEDQIVACSIIQHLLKILEVDGLQSEALFNWQITLTFIGRLLAGCIEANMNNSGSSTDDRDGGILSCAELSAVANDLIACCSQVMYIYWHVSNRIPVSPVSSPTMKGQSASPMLFSPFRKSFRYASIFRKQTKVDHADKARFDFPRKAPIRRLYEILKGQGATYRVSIDDDSTDRFIGLLRSVTECFSVVLEACSIDYLLPYLEECIFLCRELLRLLPTEIVGLLTQMLKVLFGTNLSFLRKQQFNAVAYCPKPVKVVTFTPIAKVEAFVAAYRSWLVQKMICSVARHDFGEDSLTNHVGWLASEYHQYINLLFQDGSTKAFLAEVIHLFEPVLVEALHLYNVTCSCDYQAAVVNLISHLILIRVNYSVLDPDSRILDLFCQQLSSHVESNGGVAMHIVVIDLFVLRNDCDPVAFNELAIQQEVVISALMKTLQYPETWDTVNIILLELRRRDESRWRKVSRDIFDRLLPLLDGLLYVRAQLSVTVLFQLIDLLCPRAFCPIDDVINTLCMFASKPLTVGYSSGVLLSVVCLARILLLHCPEDVVLDRASNTPSFRSLQIGSTPDEKSYKTEHGLAKLLLHFASTFCLNLIDRKVETKKLNSNLEESLTNDYLELLVWVTQSGNHPKILEQLSVEMLCQPLVDISSKIASTCAPVSFNTLYLTIVLTNDLSLLCDMLKRLEYKQVSWTIFAKLLITLRRDMLVEAIQNGQQELLQCFLAAVDLLDISDEPSVEFILQEMSRYPATSALCLQLIEKEIDARNNNISKQLQLLRILRGIPATFSVRALRLEISLCASRHYLVRLLAEQAVSDRMNGLQCLSAQELKGSDGFHGLANLCDDVETSIRCFNYSSAALKCVRKMIARSESELELLFDSHLSASSKNTSFNKLAILQLLREGISARFIDAHFFAKCIQPLSAIELNEILCDELVSGTVLVSCLKLAYKSNLSNQESGPSSYALYASSKEALIVTLRRLLSDSPRSFSVYFYADNFKIELDCDLALCDRLCSLHAAVQEMIRCSNAAEDVLSDREAQLLWNFVEMSILANLRHLSKLNASYIRDSLISLLVIAHKAETRKILLSQPQASIYRLIGCIFWLTVSAFCQLPAVLDMCLAPFSAFKYGWIPELKLVNGISSFSNVSVRFLRNNDVLKDYVFRVFFLGWSSKQQFEEIWMAMLAVLSATPIGHELCNGDCLDISERVTASSLAVQCICGIFLSSVDFSYEKSVVQLAEHDSPDWETSCRSFEALFDLEIEANNSIEFCSELSRHLQSYLGRAKVLFVACLHFGPPSATRPPMEGGKIFSESRLVSSVDGSSAARLSMDMQSCLHFLVDLVNHWFKQGPDEIPLPLLTCTVDAVVYLLDLLKHDYLDWVCEILESVSQSRSNEDELMAQTVQFGLLKCLSFKSTVRERALGDGQKDITNAIDSCIKSGITDAHKAAHLLVCQLDLLPHWNPNCLRHLFPTLSDLVLQCVCTFGAPRDVELRVSLSLSVSSLLFFVRVDDVDVQICACALGSLLVRVPVDSIHHVNFVQGFLQLLLKALLAPLPRPLLAEVFLGVRAIIHLSECEASYRQQVLAATAQCFEKPPSSCHMFSAFKLMLSALYSAKAHSDVASTSGESQFNVMVMERFDMILRQISRIRTSEANALAFGCSWFLEEHIQPSDVINKLVHEVLNADPLREPIFVGLLCQVLSKMSVSTDPSTLDWVLLAVPLLLRKQPIARALSCLTCVFLSVTRDPWMTSLREVALGRYGRAATFDQDLFVFTARQFYAQLSEEAAAESFRRVLEEVISRVLMSKRLVSYLAMW
ncbi:Huntingtin [Trichuris trichiura]|uniref:Huntingtin n=1 Tax=Trichuris trichiura TaxID=36087 RepID=A0A077Z7F2_TRITR|nr:Huntingtin [Trichuris trichiura]